MTTVAKPFELSGAQRATLSALADRLIPAGDGMPAASEVDVPGKWTARVLGARPDFAAPLAALLDAAADQDPGAELRRRVVRDHSVEHWADAVVAAVRETGSRGRRE